MKAHATLPPVDCARILPGFDFSDAYAVAAPAGLDAVGAMKKAFARNPAWVRFLMETRNKMMSVFGLQGAHSTGFPVIRQSPDEVLMGFDDKHLDFRIAITVAAGFATVTTIVRCHNVWGRIYLAIVMPFHRVIARRATSEIGR